MCNSMLQLETLATRFFKKKWGEWHRTGKNFSGKFINLK